MLKPNGNLRALRLRLIILLVFTIGLSGCITLIDFENTQVNYQDALGYVDSDNFLGQSFVIHRSPVVGIFLWLRLSENSQDLDSSLIFRIYSEINKSNEVYSGQVSYRQIREAFPIQILIQAQELYEGNTYYLELQSTGSPVWVYGRDDDVYSSGNLFRDGKAEFSDLAFQFSYAYQTSSFLEDFSKVIKSSWLLLPFGVLLVSPGWLIIHLVGLRKRLEIADLLGIAFGISLTVPVVIITWTSLVNIELHTLAILSAYGITTIASIIFELRFYWNKSTDSLSDQSTNQLTSVFTSQSIITLLLLIGIFCIAVFTRFAMVRDLIGPAWVDSVHHTLITSMIKEAGRIPETFLPFANASATNYHSGFHIISWINSLLSTQSPVNGLFLLGQVLNAGAVFSAYLLGHAITRSRLAGLVGALVVGFLTPMPAYYTSWGRYTQLTGLIILPSAFVLSRMLYIMPASGKSFKISFTDSSQRQNWFLIILAAVVNAGLFMVHSRVAIFLACLIFVDILLILTKKMSHAPKSSNQIIPFALSMGIFILLAAPILIPLVTSLIPQRAIEWTGSETSNSFYIPWRFLTAGSGDITLILSVLGLLLAVVLEFRTAFLLLGWVVLMFLSANANRFGLPVAGLVSNDSVVISLFLPISVSIGFLISRIYTLTNIKKIIWVKLVGVILVACLSLIAIIQGSKSIISIINPVTIFFHSGDQIASNWINDNLPGDVSFLINPAAWGYGMFVGSDGGYWISPLSKRITFPPTLLYAHGNATDIAEINNNVRNLLEISDDPEQIMLFMQKNMLDYLFLGVKGGPIRAVSLLESSYFEPIYHNEGVWIFRPLIP